jgi:hypothetical protein
MGQVVAGVTGRLNQESDTTLPNGMLVPKNTLIYMPLYPLMNSPTNFPEPDECGPLAATVLTPKGKKVEKGFSSTELGCCMAFVSVVISIL